MQGQQVTKDGVASHVASAGRPERCLFLLLLLLSALSPFCVFMSEPLTVAEGGGGGGGGGVDSGGGSASSAGRSFTSPSQCSSLTFMPMKGLNNESQGRTKSTFQMEPQMK